MTLEIQNADYWRLPSAIVKWLRDMAECESSLRDPIIKFVIGISRVEEFKDICREHGVC